MGKNASAKSTKGAKGLPAKVKGRASANGKAGSSPMKKSVAKGRAPTRSQKQSSPKADMSNGMVRAPIKQSDEMIKNPETSSTMTTENAVREKVRIHPGAHAHEIVGMFEMEGVQIPHDLVERVKNETQDKNLSPQMPSPTDSSGSF